MVAGQGGNFFLQAATFLLLARLLGVKEYGVFAGAFALVNAVTPYSALGSHMIFMRYVSADRSTAPLYWGNVVFATTGATVLLTGALAFAGREILGPQSIWLIAVLAVSSGFMTQIASAASAVFQTFEDLKTTAWLRAIANLLRLLAIAALLLVVGHATALQCSFGLIGASTVAATIALLFVKRAIGKMRISGTILRSRFWEGIGFSFAGSTQAVYNDVDKIMLSHYGMNVANGIYSMAYRIVEFSTTPVNAIDAAVLPRFFILNNEGLRAVIRLARKIIPLAVLSGVAAAGCTLIASPWAVRLVGHGFAETLFAIRWLCWLPIFRGIHQLSGGVLTATGRQGYRTAAQFAIAVLNFLLNLLWIPSHGWLGAAWASLISDGSLGLVNLTIVLLVAARSHQPRLDLQ